MKTIQRPLAPGIYLPLMYGLWIVPALIIQIGNMDFGYWLAPRFRDLSEWLPITLKQTLAFLACSLTVGALLNIAHYRTHFWSKAGPWAQFTTLTLSYTITSVMIFWVILANKIYEHPEGEFPILLLPSVMCYLVIGLFVTVLRILIGNKSRNKSPDPAPHQS